MTRRTRSNIPTEEAGAHIFGYTIFNDFSVRDRQGVGMQGRLGPAKGFQEYWGYLYHLDAMEGVSFPDIYTNPNDMTAGAVAPPWHARLVSLSAPGRDQR